MKIATSTNICAFNADKRRNSTKFCIEECARGGYKYLDINFCEAMNPNSRMRDNDWRNYVDEIGELGSNFGIAFNQCHLPYYNLFNEEDLEKVALMEKLIERSIIAASMLKIPWAVTHPGTEYLNGYDLNKSLVKNVDYFKKILDIAVKHNVGIAIENDFEYSPQAFQRIFGASPYELVELCYKLNARSNVGICYDFGHANLTGGFHRQALNVIGNWLKAVHVQDNHGKTDEHLLPFHGNIDWRDAMAGLADIDYKGDLTFEVQEFGRYFPKENKVLVVEYSLKIGEILLGLFEAEKTRKGGAL